MPEFGVNKAERSDINPMLETMVFNSSGGTTWRTMSSTCFT